MSNEILGRRAMSPLAPLRTSRSANDPPSDRAPRLRAQPTSAPLSHRPQAARHCRSRSSIRRTPPSRKPAGISGLCSRDSQGGPPTEVARRPPQQMCAAYATRTATNAAAASINTPATVAMMRPRERGPFAGRGTYDAVASPASSGRNGSKCDIRAHPVILRNGEKLLKNDVVKPRQVDADVTIELYRFRVQGRHESSSLYCTNTTIAKRQLNSSERISSPSIVTGPLSASLKR